MNNLSKAGASVGIKGYKTTENNEIDIFRIVKAMNDSKVMIRSENDHDITKITTLDEFSKEFRLLKPDMLIGIYIISIAKNGDKDILVTLTPRDKVESGAKYPFAVARQLVADKFDMFSNTPSIHGQVAYGNDENAAGIKQLLLGYSINQSQMINCYIHDTPKEILQLISSKNVINKILKDNMKAIAKRYCYNFEQMAKRTLLKNISDYIICMCSCADIYYQIYDINMPIDVFDPVEFAQSLGTQIENPIILEYNKDIDVSKIENSFCVRDSSYKMYIVSYKKPLIE